MPAVNTGGTSLPGPHVGIMDWAFGEYRIQLRSQPVVGSTWRLRPRDGGRGRHQQGLDRDVQRREPRRDEPDAKYNTLAGMIVNNLAAPDIVSLEEIQDNNGATNDSGRRRERDARPSRRRDPAAGGPPTVPADQPGRRSGRREPGGNIRVGFLFRTDRGLAFVDRPGGDSTTPVAVVNGPAGPQLSLSPGRIAPADAAWTPAASRWRPSSPTTATSCS